jgi:glycerophosphoryl diester phosphodiesterase
MLRIAHRGASGYAPENTLAAFEKALGMGVDEIEFDVQLSKDGAVVVIHDKFINRTTNGKGLVANKSLIELNELDAGKGEKIPTLQEVLDLVNKKVSVNIELKGKGTALPVSIIIKDYVQNKGWKYSDFFVSSFDHKELHVFKQLLPQIEIGALIIGILVHYDRYVKLGAYSLNLWSKMVRKSVVDSAHKKGLKVYAYTVNSPEEIKKMKAYGVDGVFTNYPDRV